MDDVKTSRRAFLRQIAFGGAALVLTACGGAATTPSGSGTAANAGAAPTAANPASAPAAANGTTEIEIWTGWTEQAAKNIESILDGYNKSQTKIVAKHVVVPEAMNQKLLAAVAAGNPPGAAIVFGADTAYQLAAQNALLALDEVGKAEQVQALKSSMLPALWDLGMYQGKLYFASMWNQCWGVFVNTDLAKKQGVDPSKPPQTLEELDQAWEQMTIRDGSGQISVLGGDATDAPMIMARFLGKWTSDDGKTITANDPNNLKALEWVANRWKKLGPDQLQAFYASLQGRSDRSAGSDPFLSGLIATTVQGPWEYDTILKYKPANFNYTVWPLPGPAGQAKKGMYTYGDGWIIPKGSKAPEAVWDIIGVMTGATGSKDVYTSLFTTWQCVNGPVSPDIVNYPPFKEQVIDKCPGYQDVFLDDLYKSDYYLYPPKIPTANSYTTLMRTEWEKVRLGQKGAQEALDFVDQQAQQELDQWKATSS
jgi:multiple sugar transport system substrate-binding protein